MRFQYRYRRNDSVLERWFYTMDSGHKYQEANMPGLLKRALILGLIGLVAACAQPAKDEFVVVEPATDAAIEAEG